MRNGNGYYIESEVNNIEELIKNSFNKFLKIVLLYLIYIVTTL